MREVARQVVRECERARRPVMRSAGESSLTWWEKNGRLSGPQDSVMVERHRDGNVMILSPCAVQVRCRGWGRGRCTECVGSL